MENYEKIKKNIVKYKMLILISIMLIVLIIFSLTFFKNTKQEIENSSNNPVYSLASKDAKIWMTSFENDGIAQLGVDTNGHNVTSLETKIVVPNGTIIKKVSLIDNNGIFNQVGEISQAMEGLITVSLLNTDLSSNQKKNSSVLEILYEKSDRTTLFNIIPSSVFRSELIDSSTGQNVLKNND